MDRYRTLVTINLEHEYYRDGICRAFGLRLSASSTQRVKAQRMLFRQSAINEWMIIGDGEWSIEGLELELIVQDNRFAYFTALPMDNSIVVYNNLEQSSGDMLCSFELPPVVVDGRITLHFRSRELYWEYLFIARSGHQEGFDSMRLEEMERLIAFSDIELCMVERFPIEMVLRTVSLKPIKIMDHSSYRLRLIQKRGSSEIILIESVAHPQIGMFLSDSSNFIRQICYY